MKAKVKIAHLKPNHHKSLLKQLLLALGLFLLLTSCVDSDISDKSYLIGFSQCTDSDWRRQMEDEVYQELEFHTNAELIFKNAYGDSRIQELQIDSLIEAGVDILIVSPNESAPLTPVVDKAYKMGIPVVLLDRKTESQHYTSFIGADNYEVGKIAGEKAASILNGKGRVLELFGLQGSSPAMDRHRGFLDAIASFPDIKITQQVFGSWDEQKTADEMGKLSLTMDSFDLVYAHNDAMGLASHKYFTARHGEDISTIGIDGLPGKDKGLGLVSRRILDATVIYPSGGDVAIRTAIEILNGKEFPKNIPLSSTLVDYSNARVMSHQAEKLANQRQTIRQLNNRIVSQLKTYNYQKSIVYVLVAGVLLLLFVVIGLYRTTSLIRNQKKTIEAQNRHLEELNETKNKFFSIVAHDLKSPLNSLQGFSNLMLNFYDTMKKDDVMKLMRQLDDSLKYTVKMADNLINWARIQMNEVEQKVEVFNTSEVVKPVFELYKPIGAKKNIKLLVNGNTLPLKGDKNQVEFIIRNLVNNAIKYTNAGGSVKIEASSVNGLKTRISVSDEGVGISEAAQKKLFSSGLNQSTHGTAGEKGTGLGLMLCQEYVSLNLGEMSIESKLGEGTTFHVTLPQN